MRSVSLTYFWMSCNNDFTLTSLEWWLLIGMVPVFSQEEVFRPNVKAKGSLANKRWQAQKFMVKLFYMYMVLEIGGN